jgi:uncharacterized protein YjbI with pentapeptide repeats
LDSAESSNGKARSGTEGFENDLKKLDSVDHTLSLRGRRLEKAVFDGADLRKADITGAHLQGASFENARLQSASLVGAQLQGASLTGAQLQGASLEGAQLQGASLLGVYLQGASLRDAELQGVPFDGSLLSGTSLEGAQLQGASFLGALLQGASLERAQLQGTSLFGAQLQGTDFHNSTLTGATMEHAKLWRTSFEDASLADVFQDGLEEEPVPRDKFAALEADVTETVPEAPPPVPFFRGLGPARSPRNYALAGIERLNPEEPNHKASQNPALKTGRAASKAAYQKALALQLKSLACSGDESAPYVLRRLTTTIPGLGVLVQGRKVLEEPRISDAGPFAPGLIDTILGQQCPVSAALTEQDKADLRRLANDLRTSERKQ